MWAWISDYQLSKDTEIQIKREFQMMFDDPASTWFKAYFAAAVCFQGFTVQTYSL